MDKVCAPFTPDQVASLNQYQKALAFHPFNCGFDWHTVASRLVATEDGWFCPSSACHYRQGWAWDFMADWTWAIGTPFEHTINRGNIMSSVEYGSRLIRVHQWTVKPGSHGDLLEALRRGRRDYANSHDQQENQVSSDALSFKVVNGDVVIYYEDDVTDQDD